jgi:hypothetical protein
VAYGYFLHGDTLRKQGKDQFLASVSFGRGVVDMQCNVFPETGILRPVFMWSDLFIRSRYSGK